MNLTSFIVHTKEALENLGALGLFILAFIEASFFPIPPDALLMPLVLVNPSSGIFYALLATLGSAFGALFGYYIGKKGGRPLLRKIVSEKNAERVDQYYKKYGDWALGIAGFTPIPYKIFTISSGVFNHDLKKFFPVSLISRGLRFFLEAFLLMVFGEAILTILRNYWGPLTLILTFLAGIFYFVWKRWRKL